LTRDFGPPGGSAGVRSRLPGMAPGRPRL
jgi:hypothetical protein